MITGVSIDEEAVEDLIELGVRDSKALAPARRSALYGDILKVCRNVLTLAIYPDEIDEYVRKGKKYRKLNYLEAIYMARIVNNLSTERVYVDAPDINPVRFSREISEMLTINSSVIAEHHADARHPIVSAASIVAKVERDNAVDRLRARYGDFGSGYPSDPKTFAFLCEWVRKNYSPPEFTRKSWKTWNRILTDRLSV